VPSCGNTGCIPPRSIQWRKLRDAGVLEGTKAGETIGKLSREQAEIARLRRQLGVSESRLKQTEAALEVMGKLSAFFENAIEQSPDEPRSRKK
jgi:transposase